MGETQTGNDKADEWLCVVVCSLGGLVLDYTVVSYNEVAVFQPVINGMCYYLSRLVTE